MISSSIVSVVLLVLSTKCGDTASGCDSLQSDVTNKWHVTDIKGFLRNVKCTDKRTLLYKCTHSDDTYTSHKTGHLGRLVEYTKTCSNDPRFYQACLQDESVVQNDDNNATMCSRFTCTMIARSQFGDVEINMDSSFLLVSGKICNGIFDCENTRLDEEQGCETALSGKVPKKTGKVCNDRCESWNCEDEAYCGGVQYGRNCTNKHVPRPLYLNPLLSCDPIYRGTCEEGDDMCLVTIQTQVSCIQYQYQSSIISQIVPLHPAFRCAPFLDGLSFCQNHLDQTNCSDPNRVALHCPVSGWNSSVSLFKICLGAPLCDDKMDTMCVQITSECRIHKHKLCDGEIDCNDGSDEDKITRCHTLSLAAETCSRRLAETENPKTLPIPLSWLRDGVRDCRNGRDEEDKGWQSCGIGQTFRFVKLESQCQNVFLCSSGDAKYIESDRMCDGIETCGNELLICNMARVTSRRGTIPTSPSLISRNSVHRHLSYCLKGLSHLEWLMKGKCHKKKLKLLGDQHEIFGESKIKVFLPSKPRNCDHLFGENYVLSSCTHKCIDSPCPIKSYGKRNQCFAQFSNQVFTIVDNNGIAILRKYKGTFVMDYFVCKNGNTCLDFDKVCDLVDDCGDGSDEVDCTNHFQCAKSGHYIPKVAKCNGKFDCLDLSDECNNDCSTRILNGWFLVGSSWLFGCIAVLANLWLLFKSCRSLRKCKKEAALRNKMHIILISLGDFLIGVYLVTIGALDSVFYGTKYCHLQNAWKTGVTCKILGVISSVGSHLSLFAMSGLSFTRARAVTSPLKPTKNVSQKSFIIAISSIAPAMFCASSISLFPLMETFEDYFVNGETYDSAMKIFIGAANKDTHSAVLEGYYGRMKKQTLSWKLIDQMVQGMYSKDFNYRLVQRSMVPFYGNDAVCLFKYFVTPNDPQFFFVWAVLIVDLLCFCVIAICYIVIGITSTRSSQAVNYAERKRKCEHRQKNPHATAQQRGAMKRARKTNQKIAIIISTDFACWVPFIVLCALHSIEVVDAAPWYSIISIVVLPINSVINPLLYDRALTKYFSVAALMARVRDLVSQLAGRITRKAPESEMELGNMATEPAEKEPTTDKAEDQL